MTAAMRDLVHAYTKPTVPPPFQLVMYELEDGWWWHADWLDGNWRAQPPPVGSGGPFRAVEVAVVDAVTACPGFALLRVA